MPTYDATDRYALRALTGANVGSDIDAGFAALRDDVSARFAGYSQGPIGSRPTSTGGTPGIAGRRYRDTANGREYLDTGTSWVEIAHISRFTQTWDPPSVANGAITSVAVSLGGITPAAMSASFSEAIQAGAFLTVHYQTLAGGALVTLVNLSGSTLNLSSGTLTVVATL